MDIYRETFETWNKIASSYNGKFLNLEIYNETYDFFCGLVKKVSPQILDVGCGPGNITRYILSKLHDARVLGIDVAPKMLELAAKNNPTATFKLMDCRHIDKLTTKYDGIISGFCIPYLSGEDCVKFITDSYNLLNENGVLYLSFVEGDVNKSGFQSDSGGNRVYFYFHNVDTLKQQLIENGFETPVVFNIEFKRSENDSENHTILISKKNNSEV